MSDQLGIEVGTQRGAVVVTLSGELDIATAGMVWARMVRSLEHGGRLVIDCRNLTFLDSTGINLFVRARNLSLQTGGSIRLLGLRPAQRRVLELSGVADHLTLVDPDNNGGETEAPEKAETA